VVAAGTGDLFIDLPIDQRADQRADAATLACLLTLTLMIIPARLVVQGIPFSLTPANLISLLAGACWLCAQLTTTLGVAKGRTPVRTAVFVYAVAMLATYGYASAGYLPTDERGFADHRLVLGIALVGLAVSVCDGVRSLERLDLLLKTVVVGGAIIGFVGACQFLLSLDLTKYLALPGLRFTSMDSAVLIRGAQNRVASTTGHPIEFGVVCSMILPLGAHYGYQARERGLPALRWWLCTASIGSGLFFSVSRSAVLTMAAIGFVLFLGWPNRRRLQALITAAIFLGGMKAVSPGLLSTVYNLFAKAGQDSSVQVRAHRYTQAADEISKHFWLGRGAGTWYYPKYNAFDNQYIMSMVETGAIGTAAFVMLFVYGIYSAARSRYLASDAGTRDLGLTLAACTVVPLVGAVTFDLLTFSTVTGLSFLLLGASGALLRIVTEASPQGSGRPMAWRVSRRIDSLTEWFMARRARKATRRS
jgi:O-antigen ligase